MAYNYRTEVTHCVRKIDSNVDLALWTKAFLEEEGIELKEGIRGALDDFGNPYKSFALGQVVESGSLAFRIFEGDTSLKENFKKEILKYVGNRKIVYQRGPALLGEIIEEDKAPFHFKCRIEIWWRISAH